MDEDPLRFELRLRDGTPVVVRPLCAEDRPTVAEAYRRLSPESRYARFWSPTGEMIGDAMLDRLVRQDPATHVSWAVLDLSRPFTGLGGASWWRDPPGGDEVEMSAIVLDSDHGRGIGTLLLAVLWLTALQAGAREMVGYVLPDNRKASRWLRDCGGTGTWDGYKLIYRWKLADLDLLPETPAAADLAAWLAELAPRLLHD